MLDRWWENIEHIFTQIHLRKLIGGENADKEYDATLRVLWDVYRRTKEKGVKGYNKFNRYLLRIIELWEQRKNPRPVFITTNYDIHLECSLLEQVLGEGITRKHDFLPVYSGEYQRESNRDLKQLNEPNIETSNDFKNFITDQNRVRHPVEIIKLHGSINWFTKNEKEAICHRAVTNIPGEPIFSCQQDTFGTEIKNGTLTPLIVPPILGKLALDDVIKTQGQRAVHAISCARLIVFIGYSFPETDTFMTRLLAEGVLDNDHLENIMVINSDTSEAWKDRVKNMFSRQWANNSLYWISKAFKAIMYDHLQNGWSIFSEKLAETDEERKSMNLLNSFAPK